MKKVFLFFSLFFLAVFCNTQNAKAYTLWTFDGYSNGDINGQESWIGLDAGYNYISASGTDKWLIITGANSPDHLGGCYWTGQLDETSEGYLQFDVEYSGNEYPDSPLRIAIGDEATTGEAACEIDFADSSHPTNGEFRIEWNIWQEYRTCQNDSCGSWGAWTHNDCAGKTLSYLNTIELEPNSSGDASGYYRINNLLWGITVGEDTHTIAPDYPPEGTTTVINTGIFDAEGTITWDIETDVKPQSLRVRFENASTDDEYVFNVDLGDYQTNSVNATYTIPVRLPNGNFDVHYWLSAYTEEIDDPEWWEFWKGHTYTWEFNTWELETDTTTITVINSNVSDEDEWGNPATTTEAIGGFFGSWFNKFFVFRDRVPFSYFMTFSDWWGDLTYSESSTDSFNLAFAGSTKSFTDWIKIFTLIPLFFAFITYAMWYIRWIFE